MSNQSVINDNVAEQLLERVYNGKKDLCSLLQEEYTTIDESMLYENHVAACKKIVESTDEITSESAAPNRDGTFDLDNWEALFARLDKIDRELSEPKVVAKNLGRSSSKLGRLGSMTNLNRTDIMASNDTTLNMNATTNPMLNHHNHTIMSQLANQSMMPDVNLSMMPPPPNPVSTMNVEKLVNVSESMLNEFNNMKIPSFDELQKHRIGPEIRKFFGNFTAIIHKLSVFFEELQSSTKESGPRNIDRLPALNEEFVNILTKLAKAVMDVRVLEKNDNMFGKINGFVDINLPLSEHLTEILQKYNHG